MRHAVRLLIAFCRVGVGLSFVVLLAAVLIQVAGRTLGSSPVWTEELTRFALLYLTAFGVGLSFRSGDLVNVDVVCESLPGNWPWRPWHWHWSRAPADRTNPSRPNSARMRR